MKKIMVINKDKGFTLAELLVVVAIIAILVAVSIVIFTGKQKEAKATVCEANRTSLKHHLAVDYMSGELEQLTDTVFQKYIKIDESVCPSGGTYSYSGNFENGFKIKCSYHDGDGSSGGENDPKKVIDNLVKAVEEIIEKNSFILNSQIVKEFFEKDEYLKFSKDVNMSEILKGVDLNELANKIITQNGKGNMDNLIKSLKEYESKSYKVVPYYAANGKKVVPYFVNDKGYKNLKGGKAHEETSVCYVDGNWYLTTKIHDYSSNISTAYMDSVDRALEDAKNPELSTEQAMKNNGWIKIK